MQQTPMMTPASPSQTIAQAQNRVLRNTYALLALSMVPTALGAWAGVATGLARAIREFAENFPSRDQENAREVSA